jgi:hypothetical protein
MLLMQVILLILVNLKDVLYENILPLKTLESNT